MSCMEIIKAYQNDHTILVAKHSNKQEDYMLYNHFINRINAYY